MSTSPIAEPSDINQGVHLVWGSGSGPAMKVMIALEEKAIPYKSHLISFENKDLHRAEWLISRNPRKQVPILIDNGFALTQSNAILIHLEETRPTLSPSQSAPLLPLPSSQTHILRSKILQRLMEPEDVLQKKVYVVGGWDGTPEQREKCLSTFGDELDVWEGYLKKNKEEFVNGAGWLVGEDFSLADIALYCVLAMPVERFGLKFGSKRPLLTKWYQQCVERPSVKASIPPHWKTSASKSRPLESFQG
ncbi:hypothetical protein HDU76_011685 [Blyttiomyces sp. JEL0837]|nr:hypothetical protein HDU76_011685 [Blyttiomyces sp. JEL0837]